MQLKPSSRRDKKYMALFYDDRNRLVRTTHFGGRGYNDYTMYSKRDPELARLKRVSYIRRHRVRENWRDPMAAGTLSRYLLWEKPTLTAALKKYRMMFDM